MYINNRLFKIKRNMSRIKDYKYCYKTFFYTLYSKVDNSNVERFYMAEEDYESLLARINFYEKHIIYEEFPVFNKHGVLSYKSGNSNKVLQQVLSLPDECIYADSEHKNPLRPKEIINNITFEKKLNKCHYKHFYPKESIFYDVSLLPWLCNKLIERGIFFYNLEDLAFYNERNSLPTFDFPFYIDEKLLLENYEKLNSELLYISIYDQIFVLPRDYIQYFSPINKMSMQEQIQYAFDENREDNNLVKDIKRAITKYYHYIVRSEIRKIHEDFIDEELDLERTIIDHKNPNFFLEYNLVAYGNKISFIGKEKRDVKKINNEVKCFLDLNSNYYLLKNDVKRIKFYFEAIKTYLSKHLEYKYMPQLFLKLMGLPYEAFNYIKNFDFENGNVDEFLSLIPIYDNDINYDLEIINTQGVVLEKDDPDYYFSYFVKKLAGDNIYLATFDKSDFYVNNIILTNEKNIKLEKLLNLKIDIISDIFDNIRVSINDKLVSLSENMNGKDNSTFVVLDELRDKYKTAYETKSLFATSNDFAKIGSLYVGTDFINSNVNLFKPRKNKINLQNIIESLYYKDVVFDEYLPLSYMHLGRNFIAYSSDKDGELYLDSLQKEAIYNYMSMINSYYTFRDKLFVYIDNFNLIEFPLKEYAKFILGLPIEMEDKIVLSNNKNAIYDVDATIKNLQFKDNIALENYHSKAYINDKRIKYILLVNYIIRKYKILPYFLDIDSYIPFVCLDIKKYHDYLKYGFYLYNDEEFPLFLHEKLKKDDTIYEKYIKDYEFNLTRYNLYDFKKLEDKRIVSQEDRYLFTIQSFYVNTLQKSYMYKAYEELFNVEESYFKDDIAEINSENYVVNYGYLFNSYNYNDNIYFDINDLDLIYKIYKNIYTDLNKDSIYYEFRKLGLPFNSSIKLINYIKEHNKYQTLKKDDLKEVFKFDEFNIVPKYEYKNSFYKELRSGDQNEISYQTRHKLMGDGLIILPGSPTSLDSEELNEKLENADGVLSISLYDILFYLNDNYNLIIDNNIKGDVNLFFRPSESLFNFVINSYSHNIINQFNCDPNYISRLKSDAEILYYKHEDFIFNLAKRMLNKEKKNYALWYKEIGNYLLNIKAYNKTKFDYPYEISEEDKDYFFKVLIYYIFKEIILVTNKQIK